MKNGDAEGHYSLWYRDFVVTNVEEKMEPIGTKQVFIDGKPHTVTVYPAVFDNRDEQLRWGQNLRSPRMHRTTDDQNTIAEYIKTRADKES